jgi:hypothetical protein
MIFSTTAEAQHFRRRVFAHIVEVHRAGKPAEMFRTDEELHYFDRTVLCPVATTENQIANWRFSRVIPSVEWNPVKIPLHGHPSIGIDG